MFAVPETVTRLQLEVTTGCNLGCAGCQRTIGMVAGTWRNSHMTLDRYRRVLANAPPAHVLILQGIGEPTLHPDIAEMVRLARETGKFRHISFNTNALVRDLSFYRDLKPLGLSHVSVSVDSFDPVTAEALRSGTDARRLAAMVGDLAGLFPNLTASIVLSRRNLAELGGLIARLGALGARTIEIQPLISYVAGSDPFCLDDTDTARAGAILDAARRQNPAVTLVAAGALAPTGNRCRRPLRAVYATVEGFLTPCCTTNDVTLFGRTSLAELSFAEAWRSPGVTRWLDGFFDRDAEICHGCSFNTSGAKAPPMAVADATALHRAGQTEAAETALRARLTAPDVVAGLHELGRIALDRGEGADAARWLGAARLASDDPVIAHDEALALHRAGRSSEARTRLAAVLKGHPDYGQAYLTLAEMARGEGDAQAAADALGIMLERANDAHRDDQIGAAMQSLLATEASPRNLILLANRLRLTGRGDAARALLARRIAAAPHDVAARLTHAMAALTVVHASGAEIAARRATFTAEMAALAADVAALPDVALAASAAIVGTAKPFFLAYQGEDDRPLMAIYGGILTRLAEARGALPRPPRPARTKIRVGFVSHYFALHSVPKLFRGWMRHLDRSRFEVVGYHLSQREDAMSRDIAAACDLWRCGQKSWDDWAGIIAADAPDILIYLELGMDGTAVNLACHRLAPVQCMTWGHPVTSGLPEIDYFLSSDLMEPPDGAQHYREELVRLPGLSIAYDALPMTTGRLKRADVRLRETATVYVCCQSLFKYLPDHDRIFTDIARAVPDSQFLFIGSGEAGPTLVFKARLEAAFRAAGLNPARHIVIVSPVPFDLFGALIGLGNVYLDSIGWSGGNTTLEALTLGLPVITLPTGLMRGRHTLAILTQMGLTEYVARDLDDYVRLATELANRVAEAAARQRVAAERHRLFGDLRPVRALEDFLEGAVAKAEGGSRAADAAE